MISFDTEKMLEKYGEMLSITRQLQNNMNHIEKLVLELNGEWQGQAEKLFAEKIVFVNNRYQRITLFLEEYAEQLKKHAKIYETHEEELIQRLNLV